MYGSVFNYTHCISLLVFGLSYFLLIHCIKLKLNLNDSEYCDIRSYLRLVN